MCGIVGYVGHRPAQQVLMDCLGRLEYRGYDSCGIAVLGGKLEGFKNTGRVETLKREAPRLQGTIGIGHTRWATHGPPTSTNAHPHFDCTGKVAVVHNGIVSNFESLRRRLIAEGHRIVSDTDTEVIPHLIESFYRGDLLDAVRRVVAEVQGSFAIAVVMDGQDALIAGRRESPLVIGIGEGESIIASDVPALLNYTREVMYLEDGDVARVSCDAVTVLRGQTTVERTVHHIDWDAAGVEKNGFEHFMRKEIHEQPRVIRDALRGYPAPGSGAESPLHSGVDSLLLLACGTSYHAGLVGKYVIEELLGLPVRAELGSEFLHQNGNTPLPAAAIVISQSGETADALLSLRKLKKRNARVIVVTNVPGSTASRLADSVIYTSAGPEMSVAATKTYMAQLIEFYKLALSSPIMEQEARDRYVNELKQMPVKVEQVLANEARMADGGSMLANYRNAFYIGRGINYPVALEGALKIKEISYIHAEGCAAGELKHGPFALLDNSTPVLALMTPYEVRGAMISSVEEIRARRSPVIALVDENDTSMDSLADLVLRLPHTSAIFSPVVNAVALQLIAYHAAKSKGCPVDFPRNLAKSVTVV